MKKVLVASIMQESNSFSPKIAKWSDFKIFKGIDMLEKIAATNVFLDAGYELIPTLYAYCVPGGRVEENCFQKFIEHVLSCIKKNGSVDGIWLYLHGAMEVVNIGSGEAALAKAIREEVGWEVPISVALDLHANNTKDLIESVNIICGFKTAPHVDEEETQIRAARLLIKCIENKILPRPLMIKPPLLITGERATTGVEPLKTIMEEMNKLEAQEGILCASYFVGMAWVDAPHSGASIVIVANDSCNSTLKEAKRLADLVWNAREQFGFEEETAEPDEALEIACGITEGSVFITDSGDNVTAGAPGDSAYFLKLAIEKRLEKTLIAGITDKEAVNYCNSHGIGAKLNLRLGGEFDPQATVMDANGTLRWKGKILDNIGEKRTNAVVVSIEGVDAIITDDRCAFTAPEIIESAGVNINDYNIVIVKQGYLFAKLRKLAKQTLLAFSPGSASQNIKSFTYHKVTRPIFPLDNDFEWEPGEEMIIKT